MVLFKLMAACRRMQLDPCLSSCTKLNSRQIKDLNIILVTLNLIEKVGDGLELTDTEKESVNGTSIARPLKITINKCDLMKLKSFSMAKDTIIQKK